MRSPTEEIDATRPLVALERDVPDLERQNLDLLKLYVGSVSRVRLLTPLEEYELARRKDEGDDEALRILIESNLRLVMWIARGYASAGVPILDLIQEGNLGLMHAIRKFDCRMGYRLSTYASWWIRQAIARAVIDQGRMIRLPWRVMSEVRSVGSARRLLAERLNREPTTDEIARETALPYTRVSRLLELSDDALRLDAPNGEGQPYGDLLADDRVEDPSASEALRQIELEAALRRLEPRLRRVIELRFGLDGGTPRTLDQIGRVFNVSRERVRQLEERALEHLRLSAPGLAAYLEAT
jgi:RNA polymerase primary sigma factor